MENEQYLLGALRYIHNNLVNSNITNDIFNYKWSSANYYLNENTEKILCEKFIKIIFNYFKSKNDFILFKLLDDHLYIDTIEEEKNSIQIIVQNKIENYCNEKRILDMKQFTQFHREELAGKLIDLHLITLNDIAGLCNLSLNKVKSLIKGHK